MENQFITYDLALKLKELGFDEECFGFYDNKNKNLILLHTSKDKNSILAPLFQQVFDWFREKHNLHYEIFLTSDSPYNKFHYRVMEIGKYFTLSYDNFEGTYEEARQACLEKLIELCKNK